MRARLLYMKPELRKTLGIYLWQVFEVIRVEIKTRGRKYPSETKYVICKHSGITGHIDFYWWEVELID